jgi:hypothetical protein
MVVVFTQSLTEISTKSHPGGKARSARKSDNLTAICEPLSAKCGSLNISHPYGPRWSVTGIALLFTLLWAAFLIFYISIRSILDLV